MSSRLPQINDIKSELVEWIRRERDANNGILIKSAQPQVCEIEFQSPCQPNNKAIWL